MRKWLSVAIVLLVGCGNPLPQLEGIDAERWKNDKNGCLNQRSSMKEAIAQQKEKLLALNEKQIIRLLGKPDQNELYKRNQKFYSYYIHPAPACGKHSDFFNVLIIRFNAMGLANEVVIE
ncbi:MAG: hypothetical protein KF687_12145 [Cyclobacteriaceae bacterium]|nr:hypothetical protein [Cyclobacteriaceae bacterium]